jgi:hypothetical protein
MGLISKPFTFSTGSVIYASEHNSNYDAIYNELNGSLDNSNIAAGANIADSKLASISSANKVSGAALHTLTSIPAAAGIIPAVNLPTGTNANQIFAFTTDGTFPSLTGSNLTGLTFQTGIVSFTRDNAAATGNVDYTGITFTPQMLVGIGAVNDDTSGVFCFYDGSNTNEMVYVDGTWNASRSTFMSFIEGSNEQKATISALNSDGFTLNWTKVNSPTGTMYCSVLCLG